MAKKILSVALFFFCCHNIVPINTVRLIFIEIVYVLSLLRLISFYLMYLYCTVLPDGGMGCAFSDILIMPSTFIRSTFKLFPPPKRMQIDRIFSITNL